MLTVNSKSPRTTRGRRPTLSTPAGPPLIPPLSRIPPYGRQRPARRLTSVIDRHQSVSQSLSVCQLGDERQLWRDAPELVVGGHRTDEEGERNASPLCPPTGR